MRYQPERGDAFVSHTEFKPKTGVSRRERICAHCGEQISIGNLYDRVAGKCDGEFFHYVRHHHSRDCVKLMQQRQIINDEKFKAQMIAENNPNFSNFINKKL